MTLGPQNFYHASMETPEAKHKPQNPKSQISCYNGTINIKPLALGPQNFDHTSMKQNLKPKTQISKITQNPNSKIQNTKLKTLRVQPLISTDLFTMYCTCYVLCTGNYIHTATALYTCFNLTRGKQLLLATSIILLCWTK